jgi:DegV family protein with EDD domain
MEGPAQFFRGKVLLQRAQDVRTISQGTLSAPSLPATGKSHAETEVEFKGGTDVKKVIVVTDSNVTLPQDLVEKLDIRIVPILLTLDGQTFRDGIDMTPNELYRRLRTNKHLPTTAAPSVGDFVRVYANAAREASGIVSIHLPDQLSATYKTAVMASQLIDGVTIRVLDSQVVAIAQGFVVLEAARAAATGADLDAVIDRATEVSSKVRFFAALETLTYLHRGGRIGGAVMLMGTILQIKPILYVVDGRVEVFAKPRTKRKAMKVMLQRMAEETGGSPLHVAVFHADVSDEAEELRQRVAQQFNCVELLVTEFTPVMGAHAGPGVLGVAFYTE